MILTGSAFGLLLMYQLLLQELPESWTGLLIIVENQNGYDRIMDLSLPVCTSKIGVS